MEIRHQLETKDYVQFNLFQIQHSENLRKRLKIQRLAVSFLFAGLAFFAYHFLSHFSLTVTGLFLLLSIFWYSYFPTFSKNQVIKSTEKTIAGGHLSTLFDEVMLKIDERGVEEWTSQGKHLNHWKEIQSIDFRNDYIYFFTEKTGVIILPKRTLVNREKEKLKNYIDEYYQGNLHKNYE